jgi:hypothetical protein
MNPVFEAFERAAQFGKRRRRPVGKAGTRGIEDGGLGPAEKRDDDRKDDAHRQRQLRRERPAATRKLPTASRHDPALNKGSRRA